MFASFVEMFRGHREESTETISELVRRVVDGETIPPSVLFKAATDAGMSGEDIDAMAQRMRHRDGLRRVAMGAEGAAAEMAKLTEAISKHDAALADAKQRYAAAVSPLREQLEEAEARHAEAIRAEADLLNTRWMEPALVGRLQKAKDDRLSAATTVSKLKHEHSEQTRRHEEARDKLVAAGHDPAKLEKMWRDESNKYHLPEGTEWLLLESVQGSTRARDAADKLPAAIKTLEAVNRRLDEIHAEARAS